MASITTRLLGLLFFLTSAAPCLQAGLEFEAAEIVLKPDQGERKIRTAFKFKNAGTNPLSILKVDSGCGCTLPDYPRTPIASGGEGSIPVTYSAGDRQGRQRQDILVETSDGATHELTLVIDLPVRISFSPRMLVFRGGVASASTATVTYSDGLPVTLGEVAVLTPAFELVETPVLDGGVLDLSIRYVGEPKQEARGMVRVRTTDAHGKAHADLIYLRHIP